MDLEEFLTANGLAFVESDFPSVTHPGEKKHACLVETSTGIKFHGRTEADAIYSYLTRSNQKEL